MAHYSKAPITEAIIDIQVSGVPSTARWPMSKEQIKKESEYSSIDEILHFYSEITMGATMATFAKQNPIGYRVSSEDKKQIFQLRENGFTFSRLAPYQDWRVFSTEARRLWGIYQSCATELAISRVALRYINRIDIPQTVFEVKDYLNISPETPSWKISSYFMRIEVPQKDLNAVALITQGILPPPAAHLTSVLLDIDLFREHKGQMGEAELWDLLDQFHERKNHIFESCITEGTRRLIS